MKKYLSLLSFFIIFVACDNKRDEKKSFLNKPEIFTKEEINKKIEGENFSMNFTFEPYGTLGFYYKSGQTNYSLSIQRKLRDQLKQKDLFQCNQDFCQYSIIPETTSMKKSENKKKQGNEEYLFMERLVLKDQQPDNISVEDLAQLMQEKKHLFYTGAGLSAGVVETMHELDEKTKTNTPFDPNNPIPYLNERVQNAEKDRLVFDVFYKNLMYGQPTPGHFILRDLANNHQVSIVTENLDLLHQRTGIRPIGPPKPSEIKNYYNPSDLKYLICIGLSYDDRGFIAWLKMKNPNLRIIALDLKQPIYLSSNDFILKNDLQESLASLKKILKI